MPVLLVPKWNEDFNDWFLNEMKTLNHWFQNGMKTLKGNASYLFNTSLLFRQYQNFIYSEVLIIRPPIVFVKNGLSNERSP